MIYCHLLSLSSSVMYRECKKHLQDLWEEQSELRAGRGRSELRAAGRTWNQFTLIRMGQASGGVPSPSQISLMTSSSSSFVYMWNFMPGSTVASCKRRSKGLRKGAVRARGQSCSSSQSSCSLCCPSCQPSRMTAARTLLPSPQNSCWPQK